MSTRRKLAAILFADIVGYSRQVSRDETTGLEWRRRIEELIRTSAGTHSGRLVKSIGDGVMLEFGSAVDAVDCALDIQERIRSLNAEFLLAEPVRVRIGIHIGDVVEESGDLYGNPVNIAARLEKIAPPGGICVSRDVQAQVRPARRLEYQPVPAQALHHLPEPVEAFILSPEAEKALIREEPPHPVPARQDTVEPAPGAVARADEQMTLARAQQLAEQQDDDELSLLQTGGLVLGSAVVGAIVLTLAEWVGTWQHWGHVAVLLRLFGRIASVAVAAYLFWFVLCAVFGPLLRRVEFWLLGPKGLDNQVLEKCAEVGPVPDAIAGPLGRALNAYLGITRIGRESVWIDRHIAAEKYTKQARKELLALLDRGQQLGRVAATLERFSGAESVPPHYRDVADVYTQQAARLEAAAEMFERAEAEFSGAFLTISERPRGARSDEPLREMVATFEAITEVLQSLEETSTTAALEPPEGLQETPVLVEPEPRKVRRS
jgi:class 3 adenylate cyclase